MASLITHQEYGLSPFAIVPILHSYRTSPLFIALAFILSFACVYRRISSSSDLPVVNPRKFLDFYGKKHKLDFVNNFPKYLERGRELYPGTPFRLATDMGEITILPPHWASHIRNNRDFSLNEVLRVDNYCGLPGFEPYTAGFADDGILLVVARKHLAKHLDDLNKYVSVEASDALDRNLGQSFEWREVRLKQVMLHVVSQGLACAFLGPEHCRNKEWLQLSEEYLIESVAAAANLRMYPQWLVNISHWYFPSCRKLRGTVTKARSILDPIVEKRRALKKSNSDNALGLKAPDSIDWFEEEAAGRSYDPAAFQLLLALAGIHATSDLLNEMLLRLAQDPSLVRDARAEIIKVLPSHGFTKAGLYQMMLLDSILKESLRLRADLVQMNRIALCDTKLPGGVTIKRGQRVTVDAAPMYSADTYEDPMSFDGRRFLRMRSQPGLEGAAQSTGVGPTFLAWGYGTHACPGRFFVSNQVKVTLVHLIMKYDIMLPEGYTPGIRNYGINRVSDPESRLLLRRRTPEIEVDALDSVSDFPSKCNVPPLKDSKREHAFAFRVLLKPSSGHNYRSFFG